MHFGLSCIHRNTHQTACPCIVGDCWPSLQLLVGDIDTQWLLVIPPMQPESYSITARLPQELFMTSGAAPRLYVASRYIFHDAGNLKWFLKEDDKGITIMIIIIMIMIIMMMMMMMIIITITIMNNDNNKYYNNNGDMIVSPFAHMLCLRGITWKIAWQQWVKASKWSLRFGGVEMKQCTQPEKHFVLSNLFPNV